MDNQLNYFNSNESEKHLSKTQRFIENTKMAVRKVLTTVGIGLNTMSPIVSTTSTIVPASINTICVVAPATKAISLGTAVSLLTACTRNNLDDLDTTPPTININKPEIDVTGGKEIRIIGNQLYIGGYIVASRKDDVSKNCKVILSLNRKTIESGDILKESGILNISVSDEIGNTKNDSIKLNTLNNAPEITVHKEEIDVYKGKKISIQGNQLLIGDETVVSRKDDKTTNCRVILNLNGNPIESETTVNTEGTLNITITDEEGKSSSVNIKLIINNGAPEISIMKSEVDVSKGKKVSIQGNQLFIGDEPIVSRKDDKTTNCNVSLKFNDKEIQPEITLKDEGILGVTITDEDGKSSSVNIKLNITNEAPGINVKRLEINIFGGVNVYISNNQLLFGNEVIASRSDDRTENCKVSLKFNGIDISSGSTINSSGKLILTVTDDDGESSSVEINVSNDTILGLENLKNATIQVDKEIDLLNGITFADGIELIKLEIEIDGIKHALSDPHHYTPAYPGTINIIFTIKGNNGNTEEVKVDNLTIKPLDYKALEINNIKPVDILPIIGQIELGDKQCYDHIEHLRVAEATKIRDMMREYGAGNHSAEEYKQLMNRLNTGMRGELPSGYNNYEIIGEGTLGGNGSEHAHTERSILCSLLNHANLKLVNESLEKSRQSNLMDFIQNHPNSINIFGCSSYTDADDKADYDNRMNKQSIKDLCNSKKFIMFAAGTNLEHPGGILKNKIYNGEYEADEHGIYSLASLSNSDKNTDPNTHLLVTIATEADGDINQTNETVESSKYPVGFHNNVLFSGHAFPFQSSNGKIISEGGSRNHGKYSTSLTNYFNVALASLCFQMKADITDVDELLEMIRTTSLTDYIRLDGQTQELQLMNPAGFFKKYLMPNNLPNSIESDKTMPLNKGYYKGVIFDIPGAEVKINGQRIAYNDANKSQIKNQNPFDLEWRLNGKLCRKLGYSPTKPIQGKIIICDDKWNGLNIQKQISIITNF